MSHHRRHPDPPPPVEVFVIEENDKVEIRLLKLILRELIAIRHELAPPTPTSITFTQGDPMLPPVAGNTLVYTGTLAPAGAVFPSDSAFAVTSSDPTVTPTVDSTGLVVTIPLPATFVDDPANPFTVNYTATSASASMNLSASIVPSIPVAVPTGITFTQTT